MLEPLNLSLKNDLDKISKLGHALSSPIRLEILNMLTYKNQTMKELASNLNIPLNTVMGHISIMEKAGIIGTQICYTSKGKSRACYRLTDKFSVTLFNPNVDEIPAQMFSRYDLPIGSFFDFENLSAPCGMASGKKRIGTDNDLSIFISPERSKASIIWFTHGFLEYRIPLPTKNQLQNLKSIEITFEACSEAPLYDNDYKSDISVFINDKKLGEYTSPGDFGDRRGLLNPEFWPTGLTQYGEFLSFKIDNSQTTVNSNFISFTTLKQLQLTEIDKPYLTLKIGVSPKSAHVGGINLFGKFFGDYSQDIVFTYIY